MDKLRQEMVYEQEKKFKYGKIFFCTDQLKGNQHVITKVIGVVLMSLGVFVIFESRQRYFSMIQVFVTRKRMQQQAMGQGLVF